MLRSSRTIALLTFAVASLFGAACGSGDRTGDSVYVRNGSNGGPCADGGMPPAPDAGPPRPDAGPPPGPDAGPVPDAGPDAGPGPSLCYTEPVSATASLADLEQSFGRVSWRDTAFEVLKRRWPAGHDLLVDMQSDSQMDGFADTSSFPALMESLMTVCHEETHGWDYGHADWGTSFSYFVRKDLEPRVVLDGGFPRSEIRSMLENDSVNLYASYLEGQQGTYGFLELLDEMNAYINGLGGLAWVGEYEKGGISAKDGAVAFLYFLELYLRKARTDHPSFYAAVSQSAELKALVETQWLRTHFFLQQADRFTTLGIEDARIRQLLYEPANQKELEDLLGKKLAASPCLP